MKKTLLILFVLSGLLAVLYLCMPFVVEDPTPVRIAEAVRAGIFT